MNKQQLRHRRILLVDDDADDQMFFLDALREIDGTLQCDIAHHGLDAFEKLAATDSLPDVIFLDLSMPFMNGIEFLTRLKKAGPLQEIPVVILTTTNDPASIRETQALGASAYFCKPVDFQHLRSKLEGLLQSTISTTVPERPFIV